MKGTLLTCLGLASCWTCSHAADWTIKAAPAWTVEGTVEGPLDVSGLACMADDKGFLVSDETRVIQQFSLHRDTHTLVAGESQDLLSVPGKEFDLEAIAASSDAQWYYTSGSYSVSRKSGKPQPDREHVFRVPATGGVAELTTLQPIIEAEPKLSDKIGKDAAHDGLDIEGLAERDGTLFFGLRSPSLTGKAFVLEVKAAELFDDAASAKHQLHELALGDGLGIRDLVRVSDGFLLIAGKAMNDDEAAHFDLWHWAGPGGALTKIGTMPEHEGKAEGLLVLEDKPEALRVLVVYDSAQNGGPQELELKRPAQ